MIPYLLAVLLSWVTWGILLYVVPDDDEEITKGIVVLMASASLLPGINFLMAIIGVCGIFIATNLWLGTWINKNAPRVVSWWNDPFRKKENNG